MKKETTPTAVDKTTTPANPNLPGGSGNCLNRGFQSVSTAVYCGISGNTDLGLNAETREAQGPYPTP